MAGASLEAGVWSPGPTLLLKLEWRILNNVSPGFAVSGEGAIDRFMEDIVYPSSPSLRQTKKRQ